MTFEIEKTDDEWREQLSSDRFAVLRRDKTEAPLQRVVVARRGGRRLQLRGLWPNALYELSEVRLGLLMAQL
jgi:hypothetical protein